jgi:CxxC motif-containing protein
MRNLTCIVCPIGCSLDIEENADSSGGLSVSGNQCKRGAAYAVEEISCPKRTVTATMQITENGLSWDKLNIHRVPVKTTVPCPREKIPSLLQDIYKVQVTLPVKMGDVLIANWNGEGIDVIATRTIN